MPRGRLSAAATRQLLSHVKYFHTVSYCIVYDHSIGRKVK